MTKAIKTAWDKTSGYKTITGAGLYLLFELFIMLFPNKLEHSTQDWIGRFIDWLILTGVLDKAWRNKDVVIDWIKNNAQIAGHWVKGIFKKKKDVTP